MKNRNNDLLLQILLELSKPPCLKELSYTQFHGFEDLTSEYFDQHVKLLAERGMIVTEPSDDRRANVVAQITWAGHDFLAYARHRSIWEIAKEAAGDLPFDDFYEKLQEANGKAATMVMQVALARDAAKIESDIMQ